VSPMVLRAPVVAAVLSLCAACASSQTPPSPRPSDAAVTAAASEAPPPSPRPAALNAAPPAPAAPSPGFAAWREGFRARALAAGVPSATFEAAFAGVTVNKTVLERDAFQPEFVRPIWEYLDSAVSATRIANGRDNLASKRGTLAGIADRYGVDPEVVVAIWGLESAYGTYTGDIPVVEALATLAYEGRRRDFGEEQLLAALRILAAGDVSPNRMRGSWAGAMGHTQFIPTSFLQYAVDHDGDGRRDLWSDDALDALASTANYLSRFGWERGAPAAVEVRLPRGFDVALADGRARPGADWAARGVRAAVGGTPPPAAEAELILPAGANGPAFLTYRNFDVIKRYNNATSYALAVVLLSDELAGREGLQAAWPRSERPLSRSETEEMQRRLTGLGFDTQGVDGIIGPATRSAVRGFQSSRGLPADGFASAALLARLRAEGGG